MEMERQGIRPGVVFVDGNHDYEFALFDIGRAAKYMTPGGLIFVDNVAQPGPFFAARDFLSANPDGAKSADRPRATIPPCRSIARDPQFPTPISSCCGPRVRMLSGTGRHLRSRALVVAKCEGHRIAVGRADSHRILDVQIVLRGFGSQPVEMIGETSLRLEDASGNISVPLEINLQGQFTYFTVEPWLIWRGDRPLRHGPAEAVLIFSFLFVSR